MCVVNVLIRCLHKGTYLGAQAVCLNAKSALGVSKHFKNEHIRGRHLVSGFVAEIRNLFLALAQSSIKKLGTQTAGTSLSRGRTS